MVSNGQQTVQASEVYSKVTWMIWELKVIYTEPRVQLAYFFVLLVCLAPVKKYWFSLLSEFSMHTLLSNTFALFAGVIPHIHKSLIGKKGANKPT